MYVAELVLPLWRLKYLACTDMQNSQNKDKEMTKLCHSIDLLMCACVKKKCENVRYFHEARHQVKYIDEWQMNENMKMSGNMYIGVWRIQWKYEDNLYNIQKTDTKWNGMSEPATYNYFCKYCYIFQPNLDCK